MLISNFIKSHLLSLFVSFSNLRLFKKFHYSEQDANLESVQSLKEISELEPFINKPDWSEDGVKIRQLGIVDPSQITDKKVLQHFTKLRLASMNVSVYRMIHGLTQGNILHQSVSGLPPF